jgi:kumamolisin
MSVKVGLGRFACVAFGAVCLIAMAGLPASASIEARIGSTPADSLPGLAVAEQEGTDLGLVPPTTKVNFSVSLRGRDQAGLATLLANSGTVTRAQWASTYGPDPSKVASIEATLTRANLTSEWQPGDTVLTAQGNAGTAERFLRVAIHQFVLNGTIHFYAPTSTPAIPKAFGRTVQAITGLNNYRSEPIATVKPIDAVSESGVTPADITKFYDLTPLRDAGLDGSGITVIFPEWAVPDSATLNAYAQKFGLPPFDVTVHTDPSAWGNPDTPTSDAAGEAALDLEVVHGLAPGAKEIVYEAGNSGELGAMLQTMFNDNPNAVMSSSISSGGCELEQGAKAVVDQQNSVFQQAAAEGESVFWASGDRGAFSCLADASPSTASSLSVLPGADSPFVTAVGGTTSFLASNGSYFKESAWGEPLESWGGGGGVSKFFPQPSYQVAPGLAAGSLGGRGLPDVAANADIVSGWDIYSPSGQGPEEGLVGGTSAATPCWAAITALIDEDLVKQGLKQVGFANPALYYFASLPAGLPAAPFHPIAEGSNLHFLATAGWNEATGLGSPDVAHLADDFEWYARASH